MDKATALGWLTTNRGEKLKNISNGNRYIVYEGDNFVTELYGDTNHPLNFWDQSQFFAYCPDTGYFELGIKTGEVGTI